MVKPEKFDHLHLFYHFKVTLNNIQQYYVFGSQTPLLPSVVNKWRKRSKRVKTKVISGTTY